MDVKTLAGRRTLPLPAPAVDVLARASRTEQERASAVAWEDSDLVLCTRTGRPIRRHAYVTTLAESGVLERVAQQLAGHADSRVTREVYTHVTARMLDGAAEAIERAAAGLYGPDAGPVGPDVGPRPTEEPS